MFYISILTHPSRVAKEPYAFWVIESKVNVTAVNLAKTVSDQLLDNALIYPPQTWLTYPSWEAKEMLGSLGLRLSSQCRMHLKLSDTYYQITISVKNPIWALAKCYTCTNITCLE